MQLQQNLDLIFDVDAVLRGQGADPIALRKRRPGLVEIAERARRESLPLLDPKVIYRKYEVLGVQHQRLLLEGGRRLESKLLVSQLAAASQVIIMLATIGERLEKQADSRWETDMVYALALDGAGSGAVEALANAACQHFERKAAKEGLQVSIPFSPGMVDWSVADGQPQIFALLGEDSAVVSLTPSFIMLPRKSLTMVMGLGADLETSGRTCDFCSMRLTCRYQEHYLAQN